MSANIVFEKFYYGMRTEEAELTKQKLLAKAIIIYFDINGQLPKPSKSFNAKYLILTDMPFKSLQNLPTLQHSNIKDDTPLSSDSNHKFLYQFTASKAVV